DEVSVIIRMSPGAPPPTTIRIVARFGDICTGRLRRGDIIPTRQSKDVLSLKAGSLVTLPPFLEDAPESDAVDEDFSETAAQSAALVPPLDDDGRRGVAGMRGW